MARLTPEQWAQARRTWEADAAQTFASIAAAYGVARPVVSRRADAEGWKRPPASRLHTVNQAAHAAADAAADPRLPDERTPAVRAPERAPEGTPAGARTPAEGTATPRKGSPVPPTQPAEVPMDPATEALAVAKRTAVIQRHRDAAVAGWGRLQRALKNHNEARTLPQKKLAFEDLKAAKITSETIAILQRVEREAWGLEAVGDDAPYVIERSYGHRASSAA